MNREFKLALIKDFGNQSLAAKALGMHQTVLSTLVRDVRPPTTGERAQLARYFSKYKMHKFFGKQKAAKLEGENVVNE